MKSKLNRFSRFFTGAAILLILSSGISAQAEKAVPVKVLRLKGTARYSTDQTSWKELKSGEVLKGAVLIQTAPNSMVDLCLNEGHPKKPQDGSEATTDHVVRIFENTSLAINKVAKDKTGNEISEEFQLDLRAGMIMGTVGKLHPDSKYEIKFTQGFIGVRAGTYMASSSGVINVTEGLVLVVLVGKDGSMTTRKINSRQGYDPTTGAITPLNLEGISPQPLTCDASKSAPVSATPPGTGQPRGPGMGGSLRRF